MASESVQAFNAKVAASPQLQAKLQAVTSPMDFLSLAKAEGYPLTKQDFKVIVQQAYQQWVETLDPTIGNFFRQVRNSKALDAQLHTCQSSADVVALGQQCGVQLSEEDLQQAAVIADALPGFSFERLWFRELGLVKS